MARSPAPKTTARKSPPKSQKRAPAKTSTASKAKAAADGLITAETPLLEWISAAIGLALFLLVVGVIGWEAVRGDHSPPRFTVKAGDVAEVPGGYRLTIRVRNDGGSPAAAVTVDGRLTPQGGDEETAQATLDLVADGSVREGGLFFTEDPRRAQVDLRVSAYVDP